MSEQANKGKDTPDGGKREKPAGHQENHSRLMEIVRVLTKHNVLLCLAEQKHPEKVREAFEELGPTFVKIGQILSVRTDIVSPEFAEEFKKLQSDAKSDDFSVIEPLIEQYAGVPVKQLFKSVNHKPLASASIAQVHKAQLKNGKAVVVKIQHPGIRDIMGSDILLLEKAVHLIRHVHVEGMLDPAATVAELKRSLMEELDFTKEADNIELFNNNNKDVQYLLSPRVYREYSNENLLIMDLMEGVKVSEFIEKADAEIKKGNTAWKAKKEKLAKELVDNYMKQIFDDGFFHADPHPGNILIYTQPPEVRATHVEASVTTQEVVVQQPPDETPDEGFYDELMPDIDVTVNGVGIVSLFQRQLQLDLLGVDTGGGAAGSAGPERIVYIDFGMMGRLDERTLEKFNRLIADFSEKDASKIARSLVNMCAVKGHLDMDAFTSDVGVMFNRYFDMPIGDMNMPQIFREVSALCSQNGLQLPQSVVLLAKGIATIEGIVLALDPNLSLMTAVTPYAKRFLRQQFDPKTELYDYLRNIYNLIKITPELPVKLGKVMDTISQGEMKVSMEHHKLDDLFKRLEVMINRIVMGLIVSALIIGSSMLVNYTSGAANTAASALGTAGFILATIIAGVMIIKTYRKKK